MYVLASSYISLFPAEVLYRELPAGRAYTMSFYIAFIYFKLIQSHKPVLGQILES